MLVYPTSHACSLRAARPQPRSILQHGTRLHGACLHGTCSRYISYLGTLDPCGICRELPSAWMLNSDCSPLTRTHSFSLTHKGTPALMRSAFGLYGSSALEPLHSACLCQLDRVGFASQRKHHLEIGPARPSRAIRSEKRFASLRKRKISCEKHICKMISVYLNYKDRFLNI